MPQGFKIVIDFEKYLELKGHKHGRKAQGGGDLQHKLGKLPLPFFDGSDNIPARSWLQKLQTYFSLKPTMIEKEVVQYAALHLEDVACQWWHHGLLTQGHGTIDFFEVFATKLLDRFDRQDENEFFSELATITQKGSVASYVEEFQQISIMVINIAEYRIIHLFLKGLFEPLKGLAKAFKPKTLDEAITTAFDLESPTSNSRSKFGQQPKLEQPLNSNFAAPFQSINQQGGRSMPNLSVQKSGQQWNKQNQIQTKGL